MTQKAQTTIIGLLLLIALATGACNLEEFEAERENDYQTALSYWNGDGVEQDSIEAMHWFMEAADKVHQEAQYTLGLAYRDGAGIEQDSTEAMHWFKKAGSWPGHREAQYELGQMHDSKGIYLIMETITQTEVERWERNAEASGHHEEALRWYRKAAEQGHPKAQYELAEAYYIGENGVEQDLTQVAHWIMKAAMQGHADAQANIGFYTNNGYVFQRDPVEAFAWILIAREGGSERAGNVGTEWIENKLTPTQKTQAEQRAKEIKEDIQANIKAQTSNAQAD